MRKILLDIDGVLGDIKRQFYTYSHKHGYPVRCSYRYYDCYDVYNNTENLTWPIVRDTFFGDPDFWLQMPVRGDAYSVNTMKGKYGDPEVLDFIRPSAGFEDFSVSEFSKRLCSLGEVHVVTHRDWYPEVEADTRTWLQRNNIAFDYLKLVTRDCPDQQKADYAREQGLNFAIEDSHTNVLTLSKVCREVVILDAPYNQQLLPSNAFRVTTFGEVLGFLRDSPGSFPDKGKMYQAFNRGDFGNSGLNFPDALATQAWLKLKPSSRAAIRVKRPMGGGPFLPNLSYYGESCPGSSGSFIAAYLALGLSIPETQMQFSAMMPDHRITLQGYLQRGPQGLVLDYNDEANGKNMRDAMKSPRHTQGLAASLLLKQKLTATDHDWLMNLHNQYPEDVIEFSAYDCLVGDLSSQLIIWEIRKY